MRLLRTSWLVGEEDSLSGFLLSTREEERIGLLRNWICSSFRGINRGVKHKYSAPLGNTLSHTSTVSSSQLLHLPRRMPKRKQSEPSTSSSPEKSDQVDFVLGTKWRDVLTDANISTIEVVKFEPSGTSSKKQKKVEKNPEEKKNPIYYVAWNVTGELRKMYFPTPVMGVRWENLAGCGSIFKGAYLGGKHQLCLYNGSHAIEEKIRHLFQEEDKEIPLSSGAQKQYDAAIKEANDWLEVMHMKVVPHIASKMFQMDICTQTHCIEYLDRLAQQMRDEDEKAHEEDEGFRLPKKKHYLAKLESPEERYLINIRFPPKQLEGGNGWTHAPKETADMELEEHIKKFEFRKKAWRMPSFKPNEIPEAMKRAIEAAEKDIETCQAMGLGPERYETATYQLAEQGKPKPVAFHPVVFRNPRTDEPIATPWDGTQAQRGDLVSTTACFRITTYNGLAYLRGAFEELTIHYQIEEAPKFGQTLDGGKHIAEKTLLDSDIQPRANPFPERTFEAEGEE